MAGLLAGLEKLGLGSLESMDLYDEADKEEASDAVQQSSAPVVQETDFLFDKTHECPVCYKKIKARTIKAGKARLLRTDFDLRPVYENIEPLKYDVIICPHCGYSALSRYFKGLTDSQIKGIRENISRAFHPTQEEKEVYTFAEALGRYKLCLANAIVKHAKASEKAYICLKAGWLIRAMEEEMDSAAPEYQTELAEAKKQEREFLKNALEGFLSARQNESYPMCGMDETTVEYLIAVLATDFEQFDVASRIVSSILTSPAANSRMKEKARDLKDVLIARIKEKSAN